MIHEGTTGVAGNPPMYEKAPEPETPQCASARLGRYALTRSKFTVFISRYSDEVRRATVDCSVASAVTNNTSALIIISPRDQPTKELITGVPEWKKLANSNSLFTVHSFSDALALFSEYHWRTWVVCSLFMDGREPLMTHEQFVRHCTESNGTHTLNVVARWTPEIQKAIREINSMGSVDIYRVCLTVGSDRVVKASLHRHKPPEEIERARTDASTTSFE